MTIMGFLDNLSYLKQSEEYGRDKRINRALIRLYQDEFMKKLFVEKNIPCAGPAFDPHFPVGGWFFKLGGSAENLKHYVLGQLDIKDSLTKMLPEYKDFSISMGILVRECSDDRKPETIDFNNKCEMDFLAILSAFQRQRGQSTINLIFWLQTKIS